ncbi:MAG TPA: hypothetical protein VFR35_13650 [Actinoplanes sp.]|nr:hypothetical protein [Actinoplanes sp.]
MIPEPVVERIVLVSDLHLGGGAAAAAAPAGCADPFDDDEAFVRFLDHLHGAAVGPYRLVLLGDTFDFLRVPVTGRRTGLYARNDAEAVGQLETIRTAHPEVFRGLARVLATGAGVDVVVGNHDVELARPALRDRLRTMLSDHGGPPAERARLRFFPWVYHVPGVLYAEHGNHYHDINTFRRPLYPFRRPGVTERPPAARLGGLRRLASGGARAVLRDALADLTPRGPLAAAERAGYGEMLTAFADEAGLDRAAVARLHGLGRTSAVRIAQRLLAVRLAGRPGYHERLPLVAATVHELLGSTGVPASCYVFGHTHAPQHLRLPDGGASYLNTGTWSTERRGAVGRTWVEIRHGPGRPPRAALLSWMDGPVPLSPAGEPARSGQTPAGEGGGDGRGDKQHPPVCV